MVRISDYSYGAASEKKLATVHPLLAGVARVALSRSPYDITIVWGARGEEMQNALVESGASRTPWPESKHNAMDEYGDPLSEAIDFAPWVNGGVPWNDTHIFAVIAGVFFAAAADMDVTLRWGGDWDGDGDTTDQTLLDWGHLEIIL